MKDGIQVSTVTIKIQTRSQSGKLRYHYAVIDSVTHGTSACNVTLYDLNAVPRGLARLNRSGMPFRFAGALSLMGIQSLNIPILKLDLKMNEFLYKQNHTFKFPTVWYVACSRVNELSGLLVCDLDTVRVNAKMYTSLRTNFLACDNKEHIDLECLHVQAAAEVQTRSGLSQVQVKAVVSYAIDEIRHSNSAPANKDNFPFAPLNLIRNQPQISKELLMKCRKTLATLILNLLEKVKPIWNYIICDTDIPMSTKEALACDTRFRPQLQICLNSANAEYAKLMHTGLGDYVIPMDRIPIMHTGNMLSLHFIWLKNFIQTGILSYSSTPHDGSPRMVQRLYLYATEMEIQNEASGREEMKIRVCKKSIHPQLVTLIQLRFQNTQQICTKECAGTGKPPKRPKYDENITLNPVMAMDEENIVLNPLIAMEID